MIVTAFSSESSVSLSKSLLLLLQHRKIAKTKKRLFFILNHGQKFTQLPARCATASTLAYNLRIDAICLHCQKSQKFYRLESVLKLFFFLFDIKFFFFVCS